jgi:hypothetical protein
LHSAPAEQRHRELSDAEQASYCAGRAGVSVSRNATGRNAVYVIERISNDLLVSEQRDAWFVISRGRNARFHSALMAFNPLSSLAPHDAGPFRIMISRFVVLMAGDYPSQGSAIRRILEQPRLPPVGQAGAMFRDSLIARALS